MSRTQIALLGWLAGALLGNLVWAAVDRLTWWGWAFPAVLVLAFVGVTLARHLRRPRILSPEAVQHAREQVAMRKALYDLLAAAKYGRGSLPDISDRHRRAELRAFLREILEGRGDE